MNTLRLAVDSPQGRAALWSGTVEHAGTLHRVLPKRVEDTAHGRELEVELAPLQASDRPPTFALWLAAIRAISLTATLTPAAAVWLYGRVMGWPLHPLIGGLAVLGAVLLQVGVNLLNDVEDHLRLIDLPGSLGGSGVIQRGWLSAQQVRRGAWVAFAAGVLCGLPAVVTEPMVLAGVAALGLLGAIGYSARPLSLKYVALGDLAVLLLCGPVLTLGAAASAFGRIDGGVLWLGLWFGAAAVVILHVNNMQDIEVDRSRKGPELACYPIL